MFLPFTIQHYNYSNIDSPGCLHGSAGTGGEWVTGFMQEQREVLSETQELRSQLARIAYQGDRLA